MKLWNTTTHLIIIGGTFIGGRVETHDDTRAKTIPANLLAADSAGISVIGPAEGEGRSPWTGKNLPLSVSLRCDPDHEPTVHISCPVPCFVLCRYLAVRTCPFGTCKYGYGSVHISVTFQNRMIRLIRVSSSHGHRNHTHQSSRELLA
jgi:hypothetical protein